MEVKGPLPRTGQEIVARINELTSDSSLDFFGFQVNDLMEFLAWEDVKSFLKETATKEQWSEVQCPPTRKAVYDKMSDYIGFAWEKCNDCRGLSSLRSIEHYRAWLWLLGDDDGLSFAQDVDNYEPYGRPVLEFICDRYGFWKR